MAEGTSHTHIHQAVSCHTTQVSVLQFDSILTPSPGVSIICHGLRTQPRPPKTLLSHFKCQWQAIGPQVTHNFCLTWLQIRGSRDPFLGFRLINLVEWLTEIRETLTFTRHSKDMTKDAEKHQMQRYTGQGLRGSQMQEVLSLWAWDASPSWCRCVYPLRSPQKPHTIGILWTLHLTPFPAPLSPLESGRLKIHSF